GGSVPAPDTEYLLSANDRGIDAHAAGDDRALLHGRLSHGAARLPAHRRLLLVDLGVLSLCAARTVSEIVVEVHRLSANADGRGSGPYGEQQQRRNRSAVRHSNQLRAHGQIRPRSGQAKSAAGRLPESQRLAALCRTRDWKLLRVYGGVRDRNAEFLRDPISAAVC